MRRAYSVVLGRMKSRNGNTTPETHLHIYKMEEGCGLMHLWTYELYPDLY